jgi:hypothetical protein
MNMTRYALTILIALTMPARAADVDSANYLLRGCKAFIVRENTMPTPIDAMKQGRCVGLVDGLSYTGNFCQPKGVTTGQAVAVVVKYIEARPERMHEDFGILALEALTAAWRNAPVLALLPPRQSDFSCYRARSSQDSDVPSGFRHTGGVSPDSGKGAFSSFILHCDTVT